MIDANVAAAVSGVLCGIFFLVGMYLGYRRAMQQVDDILTKHGVRETLRKTGHL